MARKGIDSPIIIGTRGSELALYQANFTKKVLEEQHYLVALKIINTKGDISQIWNTSFDKLEGKGFFTKELEEALLNNEIDLAVHSCKDLPTQNPTGLKITAYSKRANPFDILLIHKNAFDATQILKVKKEAKIGTSSARRKSQLLSLRNDVSCIDLRGNVPTRIQKLKNNEYDAIVLANAGIERLQINIEDFECVKLENPIFVPAAAQGVLAYQIRESDSEIEAICTNLNDDFSTEITHTERNLLHSFNGGCQIPLGIFTTIINNEKHTWISYAKAWNQLPIRTHLVGNFDNEKIVQSILKFNPKSVFISSNLEENDYLIKHLNAHNFDYKYHSLVDFNAANFNFKNDADWLFFSSKNGVKYFFEQQKNIPSNTKIAAINGSTAQALNELNISVHFIGKGNNMQNIAKDFATITTGKIVFPCAKKSNRTIQKYLDSQQIEYTDLVVYTNEIKPNFAQQNEEILVFTSPMNVEAYFTKYTLLENQKVIAIGNTTANKLNSFNIKNTICFEPNQYSMFDEIVNICLNK